MFRLDILDRSLLLRSNIPRPPSRSRALYLSSVLIRTRFFYLSLLFSVSFRSLLHVSLSHLRRHEVSISWLPNERDMCPSYVESTQPFTVVALI